MGAPDKAWFLETTEEAGIVFGFKLGAELHREKSAYQEIAVYETQGFGRLLVIDGLVMLTERDNFFYHEMLVHPALYTHAAPRRVVIVGGGDCGSLTEVLKHQGVEQATQVEIDERVTRVAEQFFPALSAGVRDPRAQLVFEDGIAWMRNAPDESIDVIIVDSTDPIGPAEGLFREPFFSECRRALGSGGILVQQSESPFLNLELIHSMRTGMREAGFTAVKTLCFPQPVYPAGWWSATLARKDANLDGFREAAAERRPFKTRYYSVEMHHAALALPPFVKTALKIAG